METTSEIKSNLLYYGDNLIHMQNQHNFPSDSVDLIYVDSQFAPSKTYVQDEEDSKIGHGKVWDGGIESYIKSMSPRFLEMKRILSEVGTIYVHCNHVALSNLKLLMDEIFGYKNYRTTIVWQRYPSAFGSKKNKLFPEVSDYILVYTKTDKSIHNTQYTPYDKEYEEKFKNPDNDPKGKYIWKSFPKIDSKPSDRTLKLNEESKVKFLKQTKSGMYFYKRYWNDTQEGDGKFQKGKSKGQPMTNIWTDIPRLNDKRFPTEKPEELLMRIISASSNIDSVVLDPFSGGGTTVAVARKIGRKFIGIDYSMSAILMSAKRLGISEKDIIGIPQISIKPSNKPKHKIIKINEDNKNVVLDIIKSIEDYSNGKEKTKREELVHSGLYNFLRARLDDEDNKKLKFKKPLENGKIPDISIGDIVAIEVKNKTNYYSISSQIFKYEDYFEYLIFAMFDMIGSDIEYENMKSEIRKKYPDIIFVRDGKSS